MCVSVSYEWENPERDDRNKIELVLRELKSIADHLYYIELCIKKHASLECCSSFQADVEILSEDLYELSDLLGSLHNFSEEKD
jgi:hypothetical protein